MAPSTDHIIFRGNAIILIPRYGMVDYSVADILSENKLRASDPDLFTFEAPNVEIGLADYSILLASDLLDATKRHAKIDQHIKTQSQNLTVSTPETIEGIALAALERTIGQAYPGDTFERSEIDNNIMAAALTSTEAKALFDSYIDEIFAAIHTDPRQVKAMKAAVKSLKEVTIIAATDLNMYDRIKREENMQTFGFSNDAGITLSIHRPHNEVKDTILEEMFHSALKVIYHNKDSLPVLTNQQNDMRQMLLDEAVAEFKAKIPDKKSTYSKQKYPAEVAAAILVKFFSGTSNMKELHHDYPKITKLGQMMIADMAYYYDHGEVMPPTELHKFLTIYDATVALRNLIALPQRTERTFLHGIGTHVSKATHHIMAATSERLKKMVHHHHDDNTPPQMPLTGTSPSTTKSSLPDHYQMH